MTVFYDANKKFIKRNILPFIGAVIGASLTLGAAGIALSPLIPAIAGYGAGAASALGLTTLGAGLVFGAIFAIVAAVSIRQMFANKKFADANALINAQAQKIEEAEASIKEQAEEIKEAKASIETQAREAFGTVAREANIPEQVRVAITTVNIPGQVEERLNAAITEKKLVAEDALNSAIEGFATKNELQTATANLATQEALTSATKDLASKAELKTETEKLATQTNFEELKAQVENHNTELAATLKTADLDEQVSNLLKDTKSGVTQHLGSIYAPIEHSHPLS